MFCYSSPSKPRYPAEEVTWASQSWTERHLSGTLVALPATSQPTAPGRGNSFQLVSSERWVSFFSGTHFCYSSHLHQKLGQLYLSLFLKCFNPRTTESSLFQPPQFLPYYFALGGLAGTLQMNSLMISLDNKSSWFRHPDQESTKVKSSQLSIGTLGTQESTQRLYPQKDNTLSFLWERNMLEASLPEGTLRHCFSVSLLRNHNICSWNMIRETECQGK